MLCVQPQTMTTPEVHVSDETGPDIGAGANIRRPEEVRKTAIRVYFVLSIVQVTCALVVLATSSVSVHFHSGSGGFPYYIGSFCIAAMLIVSSCLAFRVYNKGPLFAICSQSRKEVICALNWHRIVSFLMFFGCVFGLAIIWMYGLCVMTEDDCSYDDYERENKILAYIALAIGGIAIFSAAVGLILVRKFGSVFGIQIVAGQRGRLGFRDDVIGDIRRQNERIQRQLDQVNTMPPGLQGITNYGFEPPTPPPYSPTPVVVSLSRNGDNSIPNMQHQNTVATTSSTVIDDPPKYSEIEIGVFPSGPPPPYKESYDSNGGSGTKR